MLAQLPDEAIYGSPRDLINEREEETDRKAAPTSCWLAVCRANTSCAAMKKPSLANKARPDWALAMKPWPTWGFAGAVLGRLTAGLPGAPAARSTGMRQMPPGILRTVLISVCLTESKANSLRTLTRKCEQICILPGHVDTGLIAIGYVLVRNKKRTRLARARTNFSKSWASLQLHCSATGAQK